MGADLRNAAKGTNEILESAHQPIAWCVGGELPPVRPPRGVLRRFSLLSRLGVAEAPSSPVLVGERRQVGAWTQPWSLAATEQVAVVVGGPEPGTYSSTPPATARD